MSLVGHGDDVGGNPPHPRRRFVVGLRSRRRIGSRRCTVDLELVLAGVGIPSQQRAGYLGDFGVPIDVNPMDFSAWFEVYLGDRWYTFDARHNTQRIGRILMARGRDATDVAIVTSFGPATLTSFKVVSDEVV